VTRNRLRILLCLIVAACPLHAAVAGPLVSGNILVTTNGNLLEYTPSGTLVQTVPVPSVEPFTGSLRGVVVDSNGNVQLYNGTFNPALTTYDPIAGTFANHFFPGLSTVNNVTYGGVAAYQNFVYASDMATAGAGAPNGIVRFDTSNGYAAQRFFNSGSGPGSGDYIQLNIGFDNKLYGLAGGNSVNVIDPLSMSFIRSVNLGGGSDFRGIAADANGDIFGITWDGFIYHFDSTGHVLNSIHLQTPFSNFAGSTIDLTADGKIVAAAPSGQIFLTDEALDTPTSFNFAGGAFQGFANWVQPPPGANVVPEPGSLALLGVGIAGLAAYGRLRRKKATAHVTQ
jgi:hypothetical protein